jgi:hypothetical protein
MYQIDRVQNRIKQLSVKKFSDLGFTERGHLQEWLANEPMALGEELLIIQKEFDGFDDTNERLDLLALDKDGNLVLIENKLDDTGRDVVWQALKYASYCSTLKKNQILELYQKYLNKNCDGVDAEKLMCDFLDIPDFAEVVINSGNQQRIMFVAAKFRKEVTSTVLWLLRYNIRLQCFKATPYGMGDDLFLQLEQIIPTPEAAEFMIGINEKEAAEKSTETQLANRHRARLAFWKQAIEKLKTSNTNLYNNATPRKYDYISAKAGASGCWFTLFFGKRSVRVEVQIDNSYIFDQLLQYKSQIEKAFGRALSWEKFDNKKSCFIRYVLDIDGYNRDNWAHIIEWMIENIIKLDAAFRKPLADAVLAMKNAGIELPSDMERQEPPTEE